VAEQDTSIVSLQDLLGTLGLLKKSDLYKGRKIILSMSVGQLILGRTAFPS